MKKPTPNKNKRNKIVIISLLVMVIFAVLGLIAFFVGAYLSGWEIYKWFTSGTALLIYAIIALLGIILVMFLLIKRKDDDD